MHKALTFYEIPNVIFYTSSVYPDHLFYTDFTGLRGTFTDRSIYRMLAVNPETLVCGKEPATKRIVFLLGHKGSGKTTELNKIASNIENRNAYFPIKLSLEKHVPDIHNITFIDILILMLEGMVKKLESDNIIVDKKDLEPFYAWFLLRIQESYQSKDSGVQIDSGIDARIPIHAKLRASLGTNDATKMIIRKVFINSFPEFAVNFNRLLEGVAKHLMAEGKARDLLFILDGFEKIGTPELRKKILLDEYTGLMAIKTNMIITLPIELMREECRLREFSSVSSFPMIKIKEKNGIKVKAAFEKFREFIFNRIDQSLFTSGEVVDQIIEAGGGSPRWLLRVVEAAYLQADESIIDEKAVEQAVMKLTSIANYLTSEELKKLKEIKDALGYDRQVAYDSVLQGLLERGIVFEYDDGSYRGINPIVEASRIYKQYVE